MLINQKVLFSQTECQKIIDLNKTATKQWLTKTYEYDSMGIIYSNDSKWIFDRLINYFVTCTGVNILKLKKNIHFHKFSKGDRFERHNDAKKNRVYGVGVLLNNTFNGGDFIFYDKNDIIIDKVVGNAYIFDVITEHEVTPIINGERYSLLWFLENNNIKLNKTNFI